ncbi:zf-HC2 domain-containing protein [Kitasatospora viridis]|uniref:Putative zinc finger protein n=1 Tax=Kitasatospora viridis TaxID=281105 RepID=A0A561UFE5_9ACTN|nr:zf-HC2 domain-containing protein [Kitasatospora viridis]TWF98076.1 putative zinc finger protein [Kitasatospora viridis]
MSGTGRSDARRPAPQTDRTAELPPLRPIAVRQPEPAPEHLGDRLSAYLDGELGHDARERVQAHLATCALCLAEAEAARSVKQLLRGTEPPGPSGALMARLMAVAALPDDDRTAPPGPSGGSPAADPPPAGPTIGGSRLTGGSFGRGASFGGNALGADGYPGPARPPRGGEPRLWSVRRTGRGTVGTRAAAVLPIARPDVPRGRRLVVAAAGAFSVAAVTLGGFGSLGLASVAGDSPVDEPHGNSNAVNPHYPGGSVPVLPATVPLTVDYPARGGTGRPYGTVSSGPTAFAVNPLNPVVNGPSLLP